MRKYPYHVEPLQSPSTSLDKTYNTFWQTGDSKGPHARTLLCGSAPLMPRSSQKDNAWGFGLHVQGSGE